MKLFNPIILALISALTMINCKSKIEKIQKDPLDTNEILPIENNMHEKEINIFHKVLTFEHLSFELSNTGEGSISQLSIQPQGLELGNRKLMHEIDGQVVDAEIADLNFDGYPEILIYTMSVGSGSYGEVIGYSVNKGKSISQIYFPDLTTDKEASQGYRGHDQFRIINSTLTRRFPVYNEADTNAYPSGGTRQIEYKLIEGEASRQFVIAKISIPFS